MLSIKPGITGLWQVSGRNNLSYKKRVYLDALYIDNFNFIMDLRIIIKTFGVLFFPMDRGAYWSKKTNIKVDFERWEISLF